MRELEYRLVKEDYQNWIHWNVKKHPAKGTKYLTMGLYVAFLFVFLGKNIMAAEGNVTMMLPSVFVAAVVGVAMFYVVSDRNQEQIIWRRSGLRRLEKTDSFPTVHLKLEEKQLVMSVKERDMKEVYSYRDILKLEEIERMFLFETSRKTWQFVAKSAFKSPEEMVSFKTFMEEKIQDAIENPDQYPDPQPVEEEKNKAAERAAAIRERDAMEENADVDEPIITHVDTSHMGKIGKLAHMVAVTEAEEDEHGENLPHDTGEGETAVPVLETQETCEAKGEEALEASEKQEPERE